MRKRLFAYAKTKTQISFAVTAGLISAFVFARQKVQSLFYLNPKYQASSHLLVLYSLVCVGPGRKPSERGSYTVEQIMRLFNDSVQYMDHFLNLSIKSYGMGTH